MADEEELYLDNLEEFINDEDKTVTYKWLSRTLTVPSNQAKQMLFAFLTKQRESRNKPRLSVTYLVGGRHGVDGASLNQYVLTCEDRLEETKAQFHPVTSVHIYSIQKYKPKDYNVLYMVDYSIHKDYREDGNRWSHIHCKEAKRLSDGGASRGLVTRGKTGKENNSPSTSKTVNGTGSSSTEHKSKPVVQRPKKGQLPTMGMFTVKTEKTIEEAQKKDKPVQKNEEKTAEKKPDKSKPSGMLSFFGKPTSGPSKNTAIKPDIAVDKKEDKEFPPEKQVKSNKSKQVRKRIKKFSSSEEDNEDPLPERLSVAASESEEEEKPKNTKQQVKRKEKSGGGKKGKRKEPALKKKTKSSLDEDEETEEKKPKKKRKRMKAMPSDESSDEESPQTSEPTIVTETPIQDQQPRPKVSESVKRRKRQKMLRSKTYMNDDGFMVTEKVYESESTDATDEDEAVETKQEPEHNKSSPQNIPRKAPVDPKSTKQSSLMSFFGKR